jgi:hypothetical protein
MRVRAALALVVLVAVAFPSPALAPSACAGEAPHAALVVDTGGKVLSYCVMLDSGSVTGLRLIELAHDQYGLSYRSDGAAVCMLAGVGPATGDCFGDYPNYWGYWRGDASGGWMWSGSGAASVTVHGGDVQGWSWGSGDDGSSHPQPPQTTFTSMCSSAKPASPAPSPSKTARPQTKPSPSPSVAMARSGPSSTPHASATANVTHTRLGGKQDRRHNKSEKKQLHPGRSDVEGASPTPSSPPLASAALKGSDGNTVPPAGVAALVLSGALLAGGWLFLRRRNLNA